MFYYQVFLVQFPTGNVHEAITKNEDDSYSIFIDCTYSLEAQKIRLEHAIRHILRDDFQKTDVDEIEKYAHEINRQNMSSAY